MYHEHPGRPPLPLRVDGPSGRPGQHLRQRVDAFASAVAVDSAVPEQHGVLDVCGGGDGRQELPEPLGIEERIRCPVSRRDVAAALRVRPSYLFDPSVP